jgi:hypothetical protein
LIEIKAPEVILRNEKKNASRICRFTFW